MKPRFWKIYEELMASHGELTARGRQPPHHLRVSRPATMHKRVSLYTAHRRDEVLRREFRRLYRLGYKLENPYNLKRKHVEALIAAWIKTKVSASEFQNRLSIFRFFSRVIGKHDLIGPTSQMVSREDYEAHAKRRYVAERDMGWSANGVDIKAKIEEVKAQDERVACVLALMAAFALRAREAWLLRPHVADRGYFLAVNWGTKGGRDRVAPIEQEAQKRALAWAKSLAAEGASMIQRGQTWEQQQQRFYYVCRRHGISREHGIVPHGLRHEHLNDLFAYLTGAQSPVRGGDLSGIPAGSIEIARHVVAETAGHGRKHASRAYLGQFTRPKKEPEAAKTAIEHTDPEHG